LENEKGGEIGRRKAGMGKEKYLINFLKLGFLVGGDGAGVWFMGVSRRCSIGWLVNDDDNEQLMRDNKRGQL